MNQSDSSKANQISPIRGAIASRGRTQKDVAAILGISEASFSNKLSGHIRFSAIEIKQMADYLQVSSDSLLGLRPLEVK